MAMARPMPREDPVTMATGGMLRSWEEGKRPILRPTDRSARGLRAGARLPSSYNRSMSEPHHDLPETKTVALTSPALLWSIRIICLAALGISSYLAWLALSGQTAAGCGGAKGL